MSVSTPLSDVVELASALIQRPSVTPEDAGCQQLINSRLAPLGFNIEEHFFIDTLNTWARKGSDGPHFCFAGHTDVVPVGNEKDWRHPPFAGLIENGVLHGRGAADMKGSLAAMVVATERFVKKHPDHKGSISFLITSDEEGPFINGTTKVVDLLEARNEKIDMCLVGEPSSRDTLGDVVKNGRRGSLTGHLTVKGIQGHVAYPHLAKNPIHEVAPALADLSSKEWDNGNAYFPATSFQVSNIHGGTGVGNVIPGTVDVQFNFRFSTESTVEGLQQGVCDILDAYNLDYEINWTVNGLPFLTEPGDLLNVTLESIKEITGVASTPETSGGTSDGRFIAQTGCKVIELGPLNKTIHQVDEQVCAKSLDDLALIYELILEKLLANK
ncbi:succinyl-diaminopimelate desuccinylase [Pseudoalteromonas luteoviolacea CPMOR-2]|uniref:Succinyl-diaminopimelate desuccinylase n=1 Tax=Pseudoalteromonas luteoviolacea DSM 6061 TaxID=1365250 RepID=A0A166V9E0_9GAMM|nr:succinyl-diaminopimelate desuccinylase [Pseudoalteromonas luteoviolacea]KZN32392.1 succinyl-diaminopimelate desuccinylase [Pseudoalteromonas luteoviolacea DSM 6061]KZN56710.1 succinyl-diaminopimelate desuccinylase [Pseudoalteromonas luteoviolacea CPMOR-2]MBE0386096.1 succinyl-diaminopimelate desuccinylase [Pseudoalteromonas luteoviolacea DSM 6061]